MTIKALVENPGAEPQQAWALGTIPTARRTELLGDTVLFHVQHPNGMLDAGLVGRVGPVATEVWVRGIWAGNSNTTVDLIPIGDSTHPVWRDLKDGTDPSWVASGLIDRDNLAGMFPAAFAGGVEVVRAVNVEMAECSKVEQCFKLSGHRNGWHILCWLSLTLNSPKVRFTGVAWWSDPTVPAHDAPAFGLEIKFDALDPTRASLSFDESHAGTRIYDSVTVTDGGGFPFSGTFDWSGEEERAHSGGAGNLVAALFEDMVKPSKSVWQHHFPAGMALIDVDPVQITATGYAGWDGGLPGRRTTLEYRDNPSYGQQIGSGGTGGRSVFARPGAELLLGLSPTALRACRYGTYSEAFRPIWRTEADGSFVTKANHPGWLTYVQSSWQWGSDFLGKSGPGGSQSPENVWHGHDWGHRINGHVAVYYLLTHDRLAEEIMRRNMELALAGVDYWLGGRYLGRPIKHIAEMAYCLPDLKATAKQFLGEWLGRNERDFLSDWSGKRHVDPSGTIKPYLAAPMDPRAGLGNSPFPRTFVPWQEALYATGLWAMKQVFGWDVVPESHWGYVGDIMRTALLGEGFARDPINPDAWIGCHACSYADGAPIVVNDLVSDPRLWVASGQGVLDTSLVGLALIDDMDRTGRIQLTPAERTKMESIVAWAGARSDSDNVRRWRSTWEATRVL